MPELTLRRRPTLRDRPAFESILRAVGVFREEEIAVGLELLDESLRPSPATDYRWVIAEEAGSLLGFACHGEVPMTEGTYDLYWIAVRPDRWGEGIAARLVAAVEASLRESAGRWLLIETTSAERHARARRFYAKTGFAPLSNLPDYYRPGEDRVVYGKRLDQRGRAADEPLTSPG